jgi:protein O-mannosyl-transferase
LRKEQSNKRVPKKDYPRKGSPVKQQIKTHRYYDLLGLGVIILLGIIIYSNSFGCSFHFDDIYDIVNNTKIRNLSDVKTWWNVSPARPLGIFTFVLNYHYNKLDVWYYHLVNLVIHLVNACLVWWLTRIIFSSPVIKELPIARQKKVIALFTALLFVSHPLATQSVTYIVQRLASLVAMFYLFSMVLYLKARLSEGSKTSKYLLFAASFISAVAAMLTKENAFTLPFAILLAELFFLKTKKLSVNLRDWRVILLIVTFVGLILIIPLKFSFSIFNPIPPTQGHDYTVTPPNYLLTEFSVIVKYIQLLFLPINQRLDYDFPLSNNFFEIRTLLGFLVIAALVFLAIILYKKYRIISFGICWFFLTLAIESSIIPIPNVIFEHRTYLPSFGFFLILSSGICILFWNKYKYLAVGILVIIVLSNSWLTYERNKVWKDDISLCSDNISKAPDIVRPYLNRGFAYLDLGQWDKAIADFTSAIRINPAFADNYCIRGAAYVNIGERDKAIADFSRAIGINPKFAEAYYNRGVTYKDLSQWDKAIADFSATININPKFTEAYFNRGIAYANIGQWDFAITDYSTTVALKPDYTEAYYNRNVVYQGLKKFDDAINDCSKAITIDPNFVNAYYSRGIAYSGLGQWEKAIADYSSAIGIAPKYADAYFNRGVGYGNLGLWAKAIDDFTRTIEIDPNYTRAYSNREFAYRKMGRGAK